MDLPETEINKILESLDKAAYDYVFKRKETSLIPYDHDQFQHIKLYLVSKSVEGYSKGTLYNYSRVLMNFFTFCQKQPEDVTANDIRVFLFKYKEERQLSQNSLEKVRVTLASFFRWAVEEKYINSNPVATVKPIKLEKKERKPLTQIELEYLRSCCQTPRERAIVEILYSTGCRISELVGLKKTDVNWADRSIHLFGKGNKHRTSFMNAKAEVALREYIDSRSDQSDYLFVASKRPHNRLSVGIVRKNLSTIAARAGDKIVHKVTPHVLRHTTATRMLENNTDLSAIQMILGHENLSTTMIYTHNSLDRVREEHRKAII